jgi:hypothetical protein
MGRGGNSNLLDIVPLPGRSSSGKPRNSDSLAKEALSSTSVRINLKREKLKQYKEKLSCIICGKSGKDSPRTIEFHHRNPDEKRYVVSDMPGKDYSWQAIINEINKCDPLCGNCHKMITQEQGHGLSSSSESKTWRGLNIPSEDDIKTAEKAYKQERERISKYYQDHPEEVKKLVVKAWEFLTSLPKTRFCDSCSSIKNLQDINRMCKQCRSKVSKKASDLKFQEAQPFKEKVNLLKGRRLVYQILSQSRCQDCNEGNWQLLQFDHNPSKGSKKFTIGSRLNRSLEQLTTEIQKCYIVCVDCHKERTRKQQQNLLLDEILAV